MGSGVPEIILTEIIIAVAECIRGYPDSQKDFQILEAPLNPPRPAMVVLLMSMVNSKPGIDEPPKMAHFDARDYYVISMR